MIYNMGAAEMAVGDGKEAKHVVVVLANGGVDMVHGPHDIKEARKIAARAMMLNFNSIRHKVEIRPLIEGDLTSKDE